MQSDHRHPFEHDLLEGEHALRRLRPELEALVPPLKPRAIHIPYGVSVLLGVQPTMERVLPLMERYTPLANASRMGNLRDYALATAFVHHRYRPRPPTDGPDYPALVREAQALRRRLAAAAGHLADLGLLDTQEVEQIQRGRGHIGTGDGLLALATIFQKHWSMVRDNTPIERQELHQAAELGARLLAVVTERREQRRRSSSHRADGLHRRAVHMMCDVYEEARRVVAYIGWYEPELRPLPSLYRRLAKGRDPLQSARRILPIGTMSSDAEQTLVAAQ